MMPSAADFFPAYIRLFMNFARIRSPNFASGTISRRSARRRRAIAVIPLFRTLGAVERTALFAVFDALRVEHAADDVIAHAGQVLHAAAAEQHNRVLLQVMAFAGDIAHDFVAVGEAHLGHLAQRRVRLFGRCRVDARADAALLRAPRQRWNLVALRLLTARLADQLIDRRHSLFLMTSPSKRRSGPSPIRPAPAMRRIWDAPKSRRSTLYLLASRQRLGAGADGLFREGAAIYRRGFAGSRPVNTGFFA